MSTLPPGWAATTIADVCAEGEQRVPRADEMFRYIDIGSVDRVGKTIVLPEPICGANAPSRARKAVRAGDVLVSMTRPNLNAVAMVPPELNGHIASTGFEVLRAAGVDPRWLYFAVRSSRFVESMTELVQGALYPAVRPRDVRGFELPIPPLPEQRRIADKLDTLLARVNACRDRLDRVPAILKRFRQSVLDAAMSGQLTADWRAEDPKALPAEVQLEHVESTRSSRLRVQRADLSINGLDLYDLPPAWSWVKNHRLAADKTNAICAGPFGTIFKAKDFRNEGVPIVFLRHVGEGRYLTSKPGFMDIEVWKRCHQDYSIFGGELLVTKLGDPPGTACVYPKGLGVAMVTPDVMKMEVDALVAEVDFLMHFFNSPRCKALISDLAFGVTRLRIDLAMFKNFPVPLPPLEEQREIVRRVESLFGLADAIETQQQVARSKVERLTPALLAKAFRGELVPQDPNDEPAVELLKRLAQGRTDAPAKTRKPRQRQPA